MNYKYLVAVLAALPELAIAQNVDTVANEEVTVVAPRLPELTAQKLVVVSTVDHEQIEKNNCHSLTDVVDLLPGMQVNVNGGRGQNANLNLRGGPSNAVLILIDGNPLRVGLGSINANTLPVTAIERVELLKGARATFYGADAVDGVINIVTKPNFASRQIAQFSYATHGSTDFNAVNTFMPTENDVVKVALGGSDSTGYNVHPVAGLNDGAKHGLKERNFNASYTHAFANGLELYGMYNYLDFTGEYDNSWSGMQQTNENNVDRHLLALNTRYNGSFYNFELGAMYAHNNDYDHDVSAQKLGMGSSIVRTESISAHFANTFTVLQGVTLGFGGDYEHGVLKDDSTTGYASYGDSDKVMVNKAGFLSLGVEQGMFIADASYRLDDNSIYDHKSTWTAGFGVNPIDLFTFGVHVGTAYRAPNFSELYYPGFGNTSLKPEKSKNGEVTVKGHYGDEFKFSYYVTGFYSKYEDMIGAEAVTWRYINISKASNRGAELGFAMGTRELMVKTEAVLSRPKNEDTDRDLVNRSRQVYTLGLNGESHDFDYLAEFKHHSKRYINSYSSDTLPGYGTLNLGFGYTFGNDKFRVGFKADNVFDKDYEAVAGYPAEGRVLSATFALKNLF